MKTLIVIAEGMDPVVLEEEVEKGNLPWFSNQIQKKHYSHLNCGPVPYEPSNLATAFSGVNPGVHGCFSYWNVHGDNSLPRILDTNDVHASRIWEWAEMSDIRFNVVNLQLTHPPKPLNGNLISYPMENSLNTTYPRRLLNDLHAKGIRYAHDVSLFYTGEPFEEFAEQAHLIAQYQLDTALALAEDTDVLIVNLTLPDRLSHFLWYELNEAKENYRPHILRAYDFVDSACKRMQEYVSDSMMVFTEIGFGKLNGFVSIDKYLQEAGLQVLKNEKVDISRSTAMETVQGSHGIMLSEEIGSNGVASQSLRDEVRDFLLSMKFDDGNPVLKDVLFREDVYMGNKVHLAPSMIVQPADLTRPPLGDPRWAKHVRRNHQSGWHRDKGFLLVDGCVRKNIDQQMPVLESIAPTIAHMLKRNTPNYCKAESLVM